MPRFDNNANTDSFQGTGSYGFSGTRVSTLGGTEYTLVVIAADTSVYDIRMK